MQAFNGRRFTMKTRVPFRLIVGLFLLCASALLVGCTIDDPSANAPPPSTVYLLRHAEKATDPPGDPPLTARGSARARALAEQLADVPVTVIYATQYKRTQQTVEPLAAAKGLKLTIRDAQAVDELVLEIEALRPGNVIVICAHSNTIPSIAAGLRVTPAISLRSKDYGDLFVIPLGKERKLKRRRFGP